METFFDLCEPLYALIDEEISSNAPQEDGNLIERSLMEIERNTSDPTSSFHGRRGLLHLRGSIGDLFLAGKVTDIIDLN